MQRSTTSSNGMKVVFFFCPVDSHLKNFGSYIHCTTKELGWDSLGYSEVSGAVHEQKNRGSRIRDIKCFVLSNHEIKEARYYF